MRLLKRSPSGDIRLASFEDDHVPRYAILSHTWTDGQEVTYHELIDGTCRDKTGYDKICFCVDQAARDGIEYSWVDTCCIDKSTSDELSAAINSMFAWYQRATKCYVYLSDVQVPDELIDVPAFQVTWDHVFRQSRWFTRGWTLQELLAPPSVEFFSREKKRLGSKISLENEIHQITNIPVEALRQPDVSTFSIDERMQWAINRTTTKKEDKAYCLLGIFGVYLPLIYGEGEAHALLRLRKEVEERQQGFGTKGPQDIAKPRKQVVYIPFSKNHQFIGRRSELATLEQRLFTAQDCQKMAVVGLGGIGKTQVALSFAYWAVDQHPETSVFWVPALSAETFEQAMEEIAQRLGLKRTADQNDAKELVKQYLSTSDAGKWLLIVDNADDIDVLKESGHSDGLLRFLPECKSGVTLFTTRTSSVAQHIAGSSVLRLAKPTEDEAGELLSKALADTTQLADTTVVQELLTELEFLPLAITQAAAYMNVNEMSVPEYLALLRSTNEDVVYIMSIEMPDSTRYEKAASAVATTWTISFKQILAKDALAAELLQFVSCIEWKAIPHSILPAVKPKARMLAAIGTLCSYSFLSKRVGDEMYDMHRLVHLASRIWIQHDGRAVAVQANAVRHLATAFPTDEYTNREIWRAFMPHVTRMKTDWTSVGSNSNAHSQEKSELCFSVGQCLYIDGRMNEAVQWLEETCRLRTRLAENDRLRLSSQHKLAKAYQAAGQMKAAIALLQHVVAISGGAFAEDDPERLASQNALAHSYHANGQIKDAITLLQHVVAIQKQVLPEYDRDRMESQYELASAYQSNGQTREAMLLMEHVVAICKSVLAEDHPDLLAPQAELAYIYRANGRTKEALALLKHVVAISEKVFMEGHYLRLASQGELARAYQANGQTKDAIVLLEHVTAVSKRVFTEEHPDRLMFQDALAVAYQANGQTKEAIALLEHVAAVRKRVLAEDHPDRLASQRALATVYESTRSPQQAPAEAFDARR